VHEFLKTLGIKEVNSGACDGRWIESPTGGELVSVSPIDGRPIAKVLQASEADYEEIIKSALAAFDTWRMMPAPKRGIVVRDVCDELRKPEPLGAS
jgi:aldehyde dehydrogenase (NAD+)